LFDRWVSETADPWFGLSALIAVTLHPRVFDTGSLRLLSYLRLRLRRRRHERDQRVPHGLLHGVLGRAIEAHIVDDSADHHAATEELADGVAHIAVVPAEPIQPTHDERVARA